MKYLIIEDEPLAQEEMQRMLFVADPDAQIIGINDSVESAVATINSAEHPDIIFMDIHLSDNICFEIFKQVEISSPVIFTTAYDKYALQAFQAGGIGYLLKPIDEDSLSEAIARVRALREDNDESMTSLRDIIAHFSPAKNEYKRRIMTKIGDAYGYLPISEVAYFFSEDHYTFVTSISGTRSIINYTLDAIEQELDPAEFFRISRHCIVNIRSIEKITRINSRLKIDLKPSYGSDLYVARNRVQNLLLWLDGKTTFN